MTVIEDATNLAVTGVGAGIAMSAMIVPIKAMNNACGNNKRKRKRKMKMVI